MAITEQEHTFVMDLAALLKAFRETRDGAAQVVEHLTARLEACRDLDTKAAKALTQAVQKATASLHQEQARMIEQSCAELRSQHKGLHQQCRAIQFSIFSSPPWAFDPFPPGGGRLGWGGEARPRHTAGLHPHPRLPPSQGEGKD